MTTKIMEAHQFLRSTGQNDKFLELYKFFVGTSSIES